MPFLIFLRRLGIMAIMVGRAVNTRLGKIAIGVRDNRGIPRPVDYFVPPEVQKYSPNLN